MARFSHRFDDNTLAAVIKCLDCGEEFRRWWVPTEADAYAEYISGCIRKIATEHDCGQPPADEAKDAIERALGR